MECQGNPVKAPNRGIGNSHGIARGRQMTATPCKAQFTSRLLLPLLILVVLAVFTPHLNNGFIFDDHNLIEKNPLVQGTVTWTTAFTQGIWFEAGNQTDISNRYYRPLFALGYRLVNQLGNGAPWTFHLFSLGLYIAVILLVVIALRQLDFTPLSALAAAALFAFYPLVGETVYWISCTGELMLQMGLLVAIIGTLASNRRSLLKRILCLAGAVGGTLLGLLAKETAVVIAPILTLEILRHPRQERIRRFKAVIPLWLVTIGYLWVRSRIVSSGLGVFLPGGVKDVGLFGSALAWYAKLFVLPFPLTTMHFFPMSPSAGQVSLGLSLLVLLVISSACFLRFRPQGLFWLGWLIIPLLLPSLPLLFTNQQGSGPIAERYMFLSLVPWCALIVLLARQLLTKWFSTGIKPAVIVTIVIFACLAGGTRLFAYGGVFLNDTTYFQRAYAYNPESSFVLQWLGVLEMNKGHYRNALSWLDKAAARDPGLLSLSINRGFVLAKLQRFPEAIQVYQSILKKNPEQIGVHLRLANIFLDLGKGEKAIYHYRKELELNPGSAEAMDNLGICLIQNNDPNGAVMLWEKSLKIKNSPYLQFNLGMAYRNLGQKRQELMHLRQFLQISDKNYTYQRNLAMKWLKE